MPIVGWTDKPNPARGMVKLGTLYKGAPKPENGNVPGQELDHFRVEFPVNSPARKTLAEKMLIPAWDKLYGRQAAYIGGVYMLDTEVDQAFSTWMQTWAKSGILRKCDGHTQYEWRKPDGTISQEPIVCAKTTTGCACKQEGYLRFMLPALSQTAGLMGYFTLTTHGKVDISTMHGILSAVYQATGSLLGVPFILSREPREFKQVPVKDRAGNVKYVSMTKYLVQLAVDPEYLHSSEARRLLLPSTTEQLARLNAPPAEHLRITEDGEILEDENNPPETVDDIPF